jgi:hypothetical protein
MTPEGGLCIREKAVAMIPTQADGPTFQPEITPDQKAALDAASNPNATNPFATWYDLPIGITPDQKAALDAANHPDAANPFVTRCDLPIGITAHERAALDCAHQPSGSNPVATLADLGQDGVRTRVVAAGLIDLAGILPSHAKGGLKVIEVIEDRGLSTLTFDGYDPARQEDFVVQALPVNVPTRQGTNQYSLVQFVAFGPSGFTLQMLQPGVEKPALGSCMITVTEFLTAPV